jgi:hypothetical protein
MILEGSFANKEFEAGEVVRSWWEIDSVCAVNAAG